MDRKRRIKGYPSIARVFGVTPPFVKNCTTSPPIFLHEKFYLKSIAANPISVMRSQNKEDFAVRKVSPFGTACFSGWAATRIIRNRSDGILGRIALAGSRLHLKLHFFHDCAAEDSGERRVSSISALSNTHETRLWSKASRVEQDPAPPKKSFDIDMKVRGIEAVGICAHKPGRDSQ